jgi:hypothetical protein
VAATRAKKSSAHESSFPLILTRGYEEGCKLIYHQTYSPYIALKISRYMLIVYQ